MASMATAFHATTAAASGAIAASSSSCRSSSVSLGFAAASGLRGLSLSNRGGCLSLQSDGALRAMPVQVRADSSAAAGAAAAAAPKSGPSTFKVAVLGAAGGIGQPLSLLIKMSPLVGELRLYDIANVKGVAADLSHCNTPAQVTGLSSTLLLASSICL
jgi:malate dehydrogenase